ncbi:MAG: bifunctional phosphoglucose/phosphomannose isomerase [Patescibacteria group bacterium]|nr:bifunctional phosphoglucose/phosphomannose isomerase [Patescibacteria group bacterium]
MKQIILNFPKQFEIGLEKAAGVRLEGDFNKILVCAMGGSALPARLLPIYMADLKIPVLTHQSYSLPAFADEKTFVAIISYSGNTEETLSALKDCQRKKLKTIVITTGGEMAQMAQKNEIPLVLVPDDFAQPRFALGYLFSALVKALANSKVIEDKSEEIARIALKIQPADFEEQGRAIARQVRGEIPVIYSSARFRGLAYIWKIKFNENAKTTAFWNYFPELNHNEMAGFANMPGKLHFLILKDENDSLKTQKRMFLTADLIKEAGGAVDFVDLSGKTVLEKIINNLVLGDFASYYLALAYKEEPVPVHIVEDFKRRLVE